MTILEEIAGVAGGAKANLVVQTVKEIARLKGTTLTDEHTVAIEHAIAMNLAEIRGYDYETEEVKASAPEV